MVSHQVMLLRDDIVATRLSRIEAGTTPHIGSMLIVAVDVSKLEMNLHLIIGIGTNIHESATVGEG